MSHRKIVKQTSAHEFQMGPMRIKQPLPADGVDQVSPFLLLHHAGPEHHEPNEPKTRLNPHPHRGFEPVTFLFSGKLHHKDSLGNEGFLEAGDVQWMTSGSGIIHSEGPSSSFAKEGGTLELIQLWVNLRREDKMTAPKYQDIKKDSIPTITEDNKKITWKVVAGEFREITGPASTFSPIVAVMGQLEPGGNTIIDLPVNYNVLLYVLNGAIESNGSIIDATHLAIFDQQSNTIELKALKDSKVLLLAGEPINEPISSYGPFVMNYPGEIRQAVMDYETGKMGVLES
jgi:redox-sensitive bicupin YhaK (pirin superfamily)